MTSRLQYEIGTRGAQASWDAFLMIAFAMTGARAAPHETVVATMITETAAHTSHHHYTEHASPITGIAHPAALIIPLVGGPSMRISETVAHFVMTDLLLNVLGLLTTMKQSRRTEMAATQKSYRNHRRRALQLKLKKEVTRNL